MRNPKSNPLRLLPAYQLYENKTYGLLVDRFGSESVYILSAGWGLVRSNFLTPYYDITFSQSADKYKQRRKRDRYNDFRMLPAQTTEKVCFIGGKDYLPLFCELTEGIEGRADRIFQFKQDARFTELCVQAVRYKNANELALRVCQWVACWHGEFVMRCKLPPSAKSFLSMFCGAEGSMIVAPMLAGRLI